MLFGCGPPSPATRCWMKPEMGSGFWVLGPKSEPQDLRPELYGERNMATLTPEDLSALVLDINAEEVRKELLSKYPTKVARKRAKQIVVNEVGPDSCVPEIQSNVRTIPGIISQRGCTY